MNDNINGEILQDIKNGKERPWAEKKMKSTLLAESFSRLEKRSRSERCSKCGSFLKFAVCDKDDYKKLVEANFCRDRMCPMCNWRRSRKLQQQILRILHEAVKREKLRFLFLNLTVRNVPGEALSDTVTEMLKAFKSLSELDEVDRAVVGYVRTLEVTYNKDRDDFHPHIHVLLAVKSGYFSNNYIRHDRWLKLWKHQCKIDYDPWVYVSSVKKRKSDDSLIDAAFEVGKYVAKDSDYIHENDNDLTDKITLTLSEALKNRRLIGFGKLLKKIHAELNLQDVESEAADLVKGNDKNCKCAICDSNLREQLFRWHVGYRVYMSE
jgi:plasmid rolling circle replication initiator protein Rep